ncbi:uncharacterized protein LOC123529975 [Mercenaria mercenaria]|uniref:uncharacterized protein LOC123529975 n=1 Tax=Mercenaria mercenaria TaxID=6596 RepID=UPI00234F1303|nr:uncharacterized protein LOC123529975 [Mercenaria mercenaria]
MATLRFTEQSLRRVKALNSLENRFTRKKLDFFERDANFQKFKYERIKNRLVDNLHKRLAYKLVLKNHSISKAKDYQKALDQKYTYTALQGEVQHMMQYMRPERMRERKAKSLLHENQNAYDNIIFQNTQKFNKLFPEKKAWMSKRMRILAAEQEAKEAVKEPTPLPTRERNARKGIATLRRRIITLDDSKPNSPLKLPKTPAISPSKTPSLSKPPSSNSRMANRRQEISMSMMKKQKSFVDGREMTKDDSILRMESKMKSLGIDDNEENLEAKDINNNDVKDDKEVAITSDVNDDIDINKDEKRQSFLPPIENQTQQLQKSKQQTNVQTKTAKNVKLPVLKMSKPV